MTTNDGENKPRYHILGTDSVVGTVYEHPEYGRTICLDFTYEHSDGSQVYRVFDSESHEFVSEKSFLEFIQSMIPRNCEME